MKYVVRLNPKAWNPITRRIDAERIWLVEQCATKDSGRIEWLCADVRINSVPIRELFRLPKEGEPPWSWTGFGICVRGPDDAIEIKTGPADASGN